VNGTSSNYEGVTSLLKAQGIDLDHKRFLILQGEVEAIAMMKAKGANEHEEGLLEYLEDIIGTNQYIEKIEIAGKDLDLANEEHASMFLRVKAKEKECNALIGEKEEAESYLRQENTRTERRNELLQTLIWQNQRDLIKLEARVVEKRARLEEERTKNSTDAAQADEIEAAIKSATKNATELEKKVRKLQSELTALEQADVKMQETRKQLKNKLKILSKTSNDSAKQEGEMARGIEDTSTSIAHLTKELSEKRQELEIASAELDRISTSLKGVTVKHQKSLDVKQAALIPFQDQLRILQRSLDLARVSLDTLETKSNAGAKEQSKLNERLEQILGEFGETETKMTNLEKQKKDLSKKTTVHRENINNLEVDRAARSKELAMLQATAAEAMAAMSQNESGSAVLKALMRESRSGAIRGIHGRLGDLGVIDGKYDAAIATSCSYLDHIVVDTTEVGQICIEHLRRNNIGRANFIVLDKMRPAVKEASSLPLGAKRLFDLVKLKDTRFTDAMYFALTDTLVAPSLEQAQQWAYGTKRWRVVTLDGKLFETSGTVSGGGQVRRGGMGTQFKGDATITADQVRMLQDKVKEAQDELKQLIAMIGKEQTALASIEEQILRIEGEASFLNGQRGSLVVEKEMIQQKRATLSNTNISALSKDEQAEAKHLGKEIGQLQAQIAQVKKEMSPIEREIDAIQQQILDAGGMKYKVQRSKVDGLTEQIKNNESRLSDLEKEKLTLERRLANARAGQKDETAIAKVENELLELDGKLQAATHTAIELTQEFTQLQTDLDQRNDQVEQLKEKLDTLSKAVVSFRKMEYELRCAIESDEEQIVISQKAITNCTTDLKQLKLHQIETSQAVPVLSIYEDEKDLADFARNLSQIKTTIEALSEKLERSRPNLKVLEEYRQKESALCEQQAELASVEGKRDTVRTNYEGLCRRRHEEFMAGFREIGNRLKEMYQLITLGGNAELELVDSLDPFAEGVLFSVMPPRKSWKNISNLSGGEKTLSSLALVFALHAYRPTPIYIMDEIDAALDFRNVSIVAHYIKERTRDAQFIVVSLRNNMFELADRLVGIYKTYQRTKSVTIDPGQYQLSPVNS
jgi:structural maintenance of chromosome 4